MGSLHKVLLALSDSNINVDYSYLSFNRETGTPIMVIYAEDIYEVENCMESKGFVSVSNISGNCNYSSKNLAISSGV